MSAGRHSWRTAVAGCPANEPLRPTHSGAGMPTVVDPSGTGGAPAAVTDGGSVADMGRASSRRYKRTAVSAASCPRCHRMVTLRQRWRWRRSGEGVQRRPGGSSRRHRPSAGATPGPGRGPWHPARCPAHTPAAGAPAHGCRPIWMMARADRRDSTSACASAVLPSGVMSAALVVKPPRARCLLMACAASASSVVVARLMTKPITLMSRVKIGNSDVFGGCGSARR
jgi:hypothetical protein